MSESPPTERSALRNAHLVRLAAEVSRQDAIHPDGYPATRDGIFLAIKTASHELEHEAIEAWREGRCKCPQPRCRHHDWAAVAEEMLQAAAVLMRAVAAIEVAEGITWGVEK